MFIQNNKVRYRYGVKFVKIDLSGVKEEKKFLDKSSRDFFVNFFFYSWTGPVWGLMNWSLRCTLSPSWSVPCSQLYLSLPLALILVALG